MADDPSDHQEEEGIGHVSAEGLTLRLMTPVGPDCSMSQGQSMNENRPNPFQRKVSTTTQEAKLETPFTGDVSSSSTDQHIDWLSKDSFVPMDIEGPKVGMKNLGDLLRLDDWSNDENGPTESKRQKSSPSHLLEVAPPLEQDPLEENIYPFIRRSFHVDPSSCVHIKLINHDVGCITSWALTEGMRQITKNGHDFVMSNLTGPIRKGILTVLNEMEGVRGSCMFYLGFVYMNLETELETASDDMLQLVKEAMAQTVNEAISMMLTKPGKNLDRILYYFMGGDFATSLVSDIIITSYREPKNYDRIIHPLLNSLWDSMNSIFSIVQTPTFPFMDQENWNAHPNPQADIKILNELCDIETAEGVRPVITTICSQDDYTRVDQGSFHMRQSTKYTFLYPFLKLSIFYEDDESLIDHFFENFSHSDPKGISQRFHRNVQEMIALITSVRKELKDVMSKFLLAQDSRLKVLDMITFVVNRNEKRYQVGANEKHFASDGFIMNLTYVMNEIIGDLGSALTIDNNHRIHQLLANKIDINYMFVGVRLPKRVETRNKVRHQQYHDWMDINRRTWKEDFSFETEWFFLNLELLHIGFIPILRRFNRSLRNIRDLNRTIEEYNQRLSHYASSQILTHRHRQAIIKMEEQLVRYTKDRICADATVSDAELLKKVAFFYDILMEKMLQSAGLDESTPMSCDDKKEVPMTFAALPEWLVEDILDFYIFAVFSMERNINSLKDKTFGDTITKFLMLFISSPHFYSNPYIVSKMVEVIFHMSPTLHPNSDKFFHSFMEHDLSKKLLIPSLIRLYGDVESTGTSSEFYDKFTIRYHISVIIKSIWNKPVYQQAIVTGSTDKVFVKFLNMMINDTTFLLDESIECLKRIFEFHKELANSSQWNQQSPETIATRTRTYASDERQCRSHLTLANETIEMLASFTSLVRDSFTRPELVDRLAAMLNFNLDRICGEKGELLKVKNGSSYGWDKNRLLARLSTIYINLNGDEFCMAVAMDERSYSKSLFEEARVTLIKTGVFNEIRLEKWKKMAECVESKVALNDQIDFSEAPEEFTCALMSTIMEEPVILPSGHVVDRPIIVRHILNTPNDPFSRLPLTESDLVPDLELRDRIMKWKEEKVNQLFAQNDIPMNQTDSPKASTSRSDPRPSPSPVPKEPDSDADDDGPIHHSGPRIRISHHDSVSETDSEQ